MIKEQKKQLRKAKLFTTIDLRRCERPVTRSMTQQQQQPQQKIKEEFWDNDAEYQWF